MVTTNIQDDGTTDCIVRAHGGGGEMMGRLIEEHILAVLGDVALRDLNDGAVINVDASRLVMTTDSFVVTPLAFPGGDIGRLAVCGTVNDVCVMGARPIALSLGLIIEEGFEIAQLRRVLTSIATAAREAGVVIATGDTKVVDRMQGGGLFINTTGIGVMDADVDIGFHRIQSGDAVLINGTVGDHGMAVMSVRSGLEFETTIASDAAPLYDLIAAVLQAGVDVKFMRDATRGGVAGVCADIAQRAGKTVMLEERHIPVNSATRVAAEMLGFDLLTVANEGKVVCVVAAGHADRCLQIMRNHRYGVHAACVGRIVEGQPPLVEMLTNSGGRRVVQRPYGEELPRIC